jgi:hypothetical protein
MIQGIIQVSLFGHVVQGKKRKAQGKFIGKTRDPTPCDLSL